MIGRVYHHTILQEGSLPLRPDGSIDASVEHRCTSVLLWPEGEGPTRENTVVTDPCFFTRECFDRARAELARRGVDRFSGIGHLFVTHPHFDHVLQVPPGCESLSMSDFHSGQFPGTTVVPCPGHMEELRALVFTSTNGQSVWITGDAVLDLDWLRSWAYYWPNGYSRSEIVETWRSVSRILSGADVIVPGHGRSIPVTADLVGDLSRRFPSAEHAGDCPDVAAALGARLEELRKGGRSAE